MLKVDPQIKDADPKLAALMELEMWRGEKEELERVVNETDDMDALEDYDEAVAEIEALERELDLLSGYGL